MNAKEWIEKNAHHNDGSRDQWVWLRDSHGAETDAIVVPGGMVIRTRMREGAGYHPHASISMVFVPDAKEQSAKDKQRESDRRVD